MATPSEIEVYGFDLEQVGRTLREDLIDFITNIDPWDTPWIRPE